MRHSENREAKIELATIAALYYGEISEGCAFDILGIRRELIREKLSKFAALASPYRANLQLESKAMTLRGTNNTLLGALKYMEKTFRQAPGTNYQDELNALANARRAIQIAEEI